MLNDQRVEEFLEWLRIFNREYTEHFGDLETPETCTSKLIGTILAVGGPEMLMGVLRDTDDGLRKHAEMHNEPICPLNSGERESLINMISSHLDSCEACVILHKEEEKRFWKLYLAFKNSRELAKRILGEHFKGNGGT